MKDPAFSRQARWIGAREGLNLGPQANRAILDRNALKEVSLATKAL